jgi:hypothetical protein
LTGSAAHSRNGLAKIMLSYEGKFRVFRHLTGQKDLQLGSYINNFVP